MSGATSSYEASNIEYLIDLASKAITYNEKSLPQDVDPNSIPRLAWDDIKMLVSEEIRLARSYPDLRTRITPFFVAAVRSDPTLGFSERISSFVLDAAPEVLINFEDSSGIKSNTLIARIMATTSQLSSMVMWALWTGICKLNQNGYVLKHYLKPVSETFNFKRADDEVRNRVRVFAEQALDIGSSHSLYQTVKDALEAGAVDYDRAISNILYVSLSKNRLRDSQADTPWKDSISTNPVLVEILNLVLSEAGKNFVYPRLPDRDIDTRTIQALLKKGNSYVFGVLRNSGSLTTTNEPISSMVPVSGTGASARINARVASGSRRKIKLRTESILRLVRSQKDLALDVPGRASVVEPLHQQQLSGSNQQQHQLKQQQKPQQERSRQQQQELEQQQELKQQQLEQQKIQQQQQLEQQKIQQQQKVKQEGSSLKQPAKDTQRPQSLSSQQLPQQLQSSSQPKGQSNQYYQ
jgi:hypothetical protein